MTDPSSLPSANEADHAGDAQQPGLVETHEATECVAVRRSPRIFRFMLLGAIVFAIVAFILTYSFPQGEGYDRDAVFGYMLIVGIVLGITLGALTAIIIEGVSSRRARTVAAEKIAGRAPADPEVHDETKDEAERDSPE